MNKFITSTIFFIFLLHISNAWSGPDRCPTKEELLNATFYTEPPRGDNTWYVRAKGTYEQKYGWEFPRLLNGKNEEDVIQIAKNDMAQWVGGEKVVAGFSCFYQSGISGKISVQVFGL